MGLVDDFKCKNVKPKQTLKWSAQDAIVAWNMFLDNKSYAAIGKAVGKNAKAVERQIENQIDHDHRHPKTHCNKRRTGEALTKRELFIINRAALHNMPLSRLGELLGREERELEKRERKGLL